RGRLLGRVLAGIVRRRHVRILVRALSFVFLATQRRPGPSGRQVSNLPIINKLKTCCHKLRSPAAGPAARLVVVIVLVVVLVIVVLVVILVLVLVHAALGLGDLGRQVARLGGPHQDLLLVHQAVAPQAEQALVQQEHAVLAAGLDAG